ncbi:MAG: replication-associated recombination protein A [Bacteroidales bacterium]|nr:replication-associated recombination protein A [Bacteroidales bacterium]
MTPLAEQLRPTSLDNYIGQQHLVGKGAILRNAIESGKIPSMILWGPPGIGKTTLASIISKTLNRPFHVLSAISSGVKDVRAVIDAAENEDNAILFIDEIHRFNKSQQDSLLGAVEKGTITLIGATTENPSFEVISALLSRCQVYILKEFGVEELTQLLNTAVDFIKQSQNRTLEVKETEALFRLSGGDARKLLNALELIINSTGEPTIVIDNAHVLNVIQKNLAIYDKKGEMHYDIISAFIKSMRGSDPNAAVYWLARMIEGGEDPLFIARRMLIFASEDIGNSNPNALLLANACCDAVNKIGYPECRIILSQTAVYLASSVKSNSTCMAIDNALATVKQTGDLAVPLHIRNAPTKLMKDLGYHKGYKYAHDYTGNFVEQEFLPDQLQGTRFYDPGDNPRERETRKLLAERWGKKYGY